MNTLCNSLLLGCLGSATATFAQGTAEVLAALGPEQRFEMSNGTLIVVQTRANSVQVRFGNHSAAVLHADGLGGFASKDGQLALQVALDGAGRAVEVTLRRPANAEPMRRPLEGSGNVVEFWRQAGPSKWFAKDPSFDRQFREQFLELHEAAKRGELRHWEESAEGSLALVLLLDQFPRNAFRGSARMYDTDELAIAVAERAIARKLDLALSTDMRLFMYLPFGHSEDLALQERSVELARGLRPFDLQQAQHHRDIVKRFGRFPHRNPLLGRPMTPDEQKYLDEGGYAG